MAGAMRARTPLGGPDVVLPPPPLEFRQAGAADGAAEAAASSPAAPVAPHAVADRPVQHAGAALPPRPVDPPDGPDLQRDRKSTRLNSSHVAISYAVFCLKK